MADPLEPLKTRLLHHCFQNRTPIEENLANFLVHYFVLAKYPNLKSNEEFPATHFQEIIDEATRFVGDTANPCVVAMNLLANEQSAASEYTIEMDGFQRLFAAAAEDAYHDIARAATNDVIHRKVFELLVSLAYPVAVCAPSELVPSDDSAVARGLQAALNSVLPRQECASFRDMLRRAATEGARSPAEVRERGGVQLLEVFDICFGVYAISSDVEDSLRAAAQAASQFAAALEAHLREVRRVVENELQPLLFYASEHERPDTPARAQSFDYLRATSLAAAAAVTAATRLLERAETVLERLSGAHTEFSSETSDLRFLIARRASVPKGEVYPRFIRVSRAYRAALHAAGELGLLVAWEKRTREFSTFRAFMGEGGLTANVEEALLDGYADWDASGRASGRGKEVPPRAQGDGGASPRARAGISDLSQFRPLAAAELETIPLAFGGFSLEALTSAVYPTPGLVFPVRGVSTTPSEIAARICVLPARGREGAGVLAGFHSAEARQRFFAAPAAHLTRLVVSVLSDASLMPLMMLCDLSELADILSAPPMRVAAEAEVGRIPSLDAAASELSPALVMNLAFLDRLRALQAHKVAVAARRALQPRAAPQLVPVNAVDHPDISSSAAVKSADVQTPDEFPHAPQPNYTSSEWELRRRALALYRLTQKATHSAQTFESHFRRDGVAQTVEMRTHETQTQGDAGTHAKQHFRYVRGVRGRPEHADFRKDAVQQPMPPVELTFDPNDVAAPRRANGRRDAAV